MPGLYNRIDTAWLQTASSHYTWEQNSVENNEADTAGVQIAMPISGV
jgi:hypothetical protein